MSDYLDPADLQLWAPTDAAGVELVYPGSAWTWSAWTEVLAAVGASGACISGVSWIPGSAGATTMREQEVQVGVGAAGAETPLLTLHARGPSSNFPPDSTSGFNYLPFWIDVSASARLAVRYRSSNSHSYGNGRVAVGYVQKPVAGSRASTAQPVKCLPDGTDSVSWVSPADWDYSAWTQLTAALATDILVLGVMCASKNVNDAEGAAEIDVGVGAAGAEAAVMTVITGRHALALYKSFALSGPPHGVIVSAGSRLALRYRGTLDEGETNLWAWIHYMELPL